MCHYIILCIYDIYIYIAVDMCYVSICTYIAWNYKHEQVTKWHVYPFAATSRYLAMEHVPFLWPIYHVAGPTLETWKVWGKHEKPSIVPSWKCVVPFFLFSWGVLFVCFSIAWCPLLVGCLPKSDGKTHILIRYLKPTRQLANHSLVSYIILLLLKYVLH